jgi:hypothetical protein
MARFRTYLGKGQWSEWVEGKEGADVIRCAHCHKLINGRKFRFQVIGALFVCCSAACRDLLKRSL